MAEANKLEYSSYPFPRLSGEYGVGVFDLLPSLNEEEPLLVRLYYPTTKKAHEVPKSELFLPSSSAEYYYVKAQLIGLETVPSILAAPMSYVLSKFSGE